MSELSYLCGSAAATLAAAGTRAATEKVTLSLLNAPPLLRRIWHILDFDMKMLPDDGGASKGQYRGDRG